MGQLQRMQLIEHQSRAFLEGVIENINDQWVFFDYETDEAMMLEHYIDQEIEIYVQHKWIKGILEEDGRLNHKNETIFLLDKMKVRMRKQIVFSLQMLLDEFEDDVFLQFLSTLNTLDFSIYDCIFCHNHLSFLDNLDKKQGVNILIFDNEESVVAVQHHFIYENEKQDRFEFTLSTGKRVVIDKMLK
ncbi:DUF2777 family protein [Heyndrickxia oleronia]|uniref:DUF2777 family protein n=1 Tax=Heyndrickxia oleronia TaxID=38875 RepID=UPI001B01EF1D|nr:DUF2777 family protein [Heyndrickxia oleronia]GIN37935.1 hypothetical protein J19TS1_08840 [Heyndrickxia oleronia]